MGIPLPRKREFEIVIMVEVLIEEMFGSDRNRPTDYRRAVVIDAGSTNAANKHTLRSECECVGRNSLTEPTLLEMSGYPTNQELGSYSGKSSGRTCGTELYSLQCMTSFSGKKDPNHRLPAAVSGRRTNTLL